MTIIRALIVAILVGWTAAGCSTAPTIPPDLAGGPDQTPQVTPQKEGTPCPPQRDTIRKPSTVTCPTSLTHKGRQALFDEALDFCQAAQEFWQNGDLDNALEALDKAYSLILQADGDTDPKLMQQKEDLRFTIAKRILEIHASRNIVVNGQHREIPMDRNRHVEAEIASLTGPERDFFIASLKRSGRYRPQIVAALREAGLPEALSWLPLIESGFKVEAFSPARALGLWQFIPSTGYKFGLKRDVYIDERLDPYKATTAAIAYLTELHSIFGDWTTVLAAYNCGEGRVLRTIRSQNINYLDNFWDLYERLPAETARYVPRFLATLHILQEPERYGLAGIKPDPPFDFETIEISRRVALKDVASAITVDEQELRQLNPELRHRIAPGGEYPLKVPAGRGDILLAALDSIPQTTARPQSSGLVHHRVKAGETLSSIARRYKTSVSAIMRANYMRRSNHIIAGRSIKVPTQGGLTEASDIATPKIATASASSAARSQTIRHTVRSGDSLWILARRYSTTAQRIQSANKLSSPHLSIGQTLVIPSGAAQQAQPAPRFKVYQVKKGDTPFMIATRHNMPLERLLSINRLSPRCTIYPGQNLYIE